MQRGQQERFGQNRNVPFVGQNQPRLEQARPTLGNQPPLPNTTPVRYAQVEDPTQGYELVSMPPYYSKNDYPYFETYEDQGNQLYSIQEPSNEDPNTLMLIQAPMRARQTPLRTQGPCFGCGGDHWLRECPDKPTISYGMSKLPPLERYCIGCGQDHFPKDCPTRQTENTKAQPSQGLNYIQVIPSPNSSDREQEDISVKVITRAQAKN